METAKERRLALLGISYAISTIVADIARKLTRVEFDRSVLNATGPGKWRAIRSGQIDFQTLS